MRRYTLALIFTLLAGCTPYAKNNWFLGGYDETQLDDYVYQVTFRGNKYTSMQRAIDYTLLRCAELTLEKGMRYFVLLDSQARENTSIKYNPGSLNVPASYGISNKPRTSNMIYVLRNKPKDAFSYNAAQVVKSMKAKYGIT